MIALKLTNSLTETVGIASLLSVLKKVRINIYNVEQRIEKVTTASSCVTATRT